MRSEHPDFWLSSGEESDDSLQEPDSEVPQHPSDFNLAPFLDNDVPSVPILPIQPSHTRSSISHQHNDGVANPASSIERPKSFLNKTGDSMGENDKVDPVQQATVCQKNCSYMDSQRYRFEKAPAQESTVAQAHNTEIPPDYSKQEVANHTLEAQQQSEQITSATAAPESLERTAQIAVVGRELNDNIYSKICERMSASSHVPLRFIKMQSRDVKDTRKTKHLLLCLYILPASGFLEEDITTLAEILRGLPVLVVSSGKPTVIDLEEKLDVRLRQAMSRHDAPNSKPAPWSCASMQELSSINIQDFLDRSKSPLVNIPIQRSKNQVDHSDQTRSAQCCSSIPKLALILALALFLCTAALNIFVALPQPSYAVLRHIQYMPNGRTSIVHLDLYLSNGSPFIGTDLHYFHVRILNEYKPLDLHEHSEEVTIVAKPIIEDLHNGTYRIYTTIQRTRRYNSNSRSQSWLCAEKPRYYIYLWSQGGSRVLNTPTELVWPKQTLTSLTEQDANEEKFPLLITTPDLEDDDEDMMLNLWKEKMRFLPSPVAEKISSLMNPMMDEYWDVVQPMLCELHIVIHSTVSDALQTIESAINIASKLIGHLGFALVQFVHEIALPMIRDFQNLFAVSFNNQ
ncbi:hypothetical protein BGX27_002329, partial [Mortierella sp. AM989]